MQGASRINGLAVAEHPRVGYCLEARTEAPLGERRGSGTLAPGETLGFVDERIREPDDVKRPEHDGRWRLHPWRPVRGRKPKPSGGLGGAGVREPRDPSPRSGAASAARRAHPSSD